MFGQQRLSTAQRYGSRRYSMISYVEPQPKPMRASHPTRVRARRRWRTFIVILRFIARMKGFARNKARLMPKELAMIEAAYRRVAQTLPMVDEVALSAVLDVLGLPRSMEECKQLLEMVKHAEGRLVNPGHVRKIIHRLKQNHVVTTTSDVAEAFMAIGGSGDFIAAGKVVETLEEFGVVAPSAVVTVARGRSPSDPFRLKAIGEAVSSDEATSGDDGDASMSMAEGRPTIHFREFSQLATDRQARPLYGVTPYMPNADASIEASPNANLAAVPSGSMPPNGTAGGDSIEREGRAFGMSGRRGSNSAFESSGLDLSMNSWGTNSKVNSRRSSAPKGPSEVERFIEKAYSTTSPSALRHGEKSLNKKEAALKQTVKDALKLKQGQWTRSDPEGLGLVWEPKLVDVSPLRTHSHDFGVAERLRASITPPPDEEEGGSRSPSPHRRGCNGSAKDASPVRGILRPSTGPGVRTSAPPPAAQQRHPQATQLRQGTAAASRFTQERPSSAMTRSAVAAAAFAHNPGKISRPSSAGGASHLGNSMESASRPRSASAAIARAANRGRSGSVRRPSTAGTVRSERTAGEVAAAAQTEMRFTELSQPPSFAITPQQRRALVFKNVAKVVPSPEVGTGWNWSAATRGAAANLVAAQNAARSVYAENRAAELRAAAPPPMRPVVAPGQAGGWLSVNGTTTVVPSNKRAA